MSLPYPAGVSCSFKTVELQARNGQEILSMPRITMEQPISIISRQTSP